MGSKTRSPRTNNDFANSPISSGSFYVFDLIVYLMTMTNSLIEKEKEKLMAAIILERKRLGLTQSQLAKKVGVVQSRIAQCESGAAFVNIDVLLKILSALGLTFGILVNQAR